MRTIVNFHDLALLPSLAGFTATAVILAIAGLNSGCAVDGTDQVVEDESPITDVTAEADDDTEFIGSPDGAGVEHIGSPDTEDTGYLPEEEILPVLHIEFEDTGIFDPRIVPGIRAAYMGTLVLTAEFGDVYLRGMMLRGFVDANGDSSFSCPNEDGMIVAEYLEDIFLMDLETTTVTIGTANPDNDAMIPLFEEHETIIEDGVSLELDIFAGISPDMPAVEGAAFAIDLDNPDNIWTSNDVEIDIVSSNGSPDGPGVFVYFE